MPSPSYFSKDKKAVKPGPHWQGSAFGQKAAKQAAMPQQKPAPATGQAPPAQPAPAIQRPAAPSPQPAVQQPRGVQDGLSFKNAAQSMMQAKQGLPQAQGGPLTKAIAQFGGKPTPRLGDPQQTGMLTSALESGGSLVGGLADAIPDVVETGTAEAPSLVETVTEGVKDLQGTQFEGLTGNAPNVPPESVVSPDADLGDFEYDGRYQDDIGATLDSINQNVADQQQHVMAMLDQQKQTALNDLAGQLASKGLGTSPATMGAAQSMMEVQFANLAAQKGMELEKQGIEMQLAKLNQLGALAEAQGNLDMKGKLAEKAAEFQKVLLDLDIQAQAFAEKNVAIQNAWSQISAYLDASAQVSGTDQTALDGLFALLGTLDLENMTPEEITAAINELLGQYAAAQS